MFARKWSTKGSKDKGTRPRGVYIVQASMLRRREETKFRALPHRSCHLQPAFPPGNCSLPVREARITDLMVGQVPGVD